RKRGAPSTSRACAPIESRGYWIVALTSDDILFEASNRGQIFSGRALGAAHGGGWTNRHPPPLAARDTAAARRQPEDSGIATASHAGSFPPAAAVVDWPAGSLQHGRAAACGPCRGKSLPEEARTVLVAKDCTRDIRDKPTIPVG